MPVDRGSLKAADLRELATRDGVVILPVAAIEQHGPHPPVMLDTLLRTEITMPALEHAGPEHAGSGADRPERVV